MFWCSITNYAWEINQFTFHVHSTLLHTIITKTSSNILCYMESTWECFWSIQSNRLSARKETFLLKIHWAIKLFVSWISDIRKNSNFDFQHKFPIGIILKNISMVSDISNVSKDIKYMLCVERRQVQKIILRTCAVNV